MSRPSHRIVIKDKKDNIRTQIGAVWPIRHASFSNCFSVLLGNKFEGEECEVEILVKPKGGKPFKVTNETHFLDILALKSRDDQGEDEEEDEDF